MLLHLFKKVEVAHDVPPEIRSLLQELEQIKDKEQYLKSAYKLINKHYHGSRFLIYVKFFDLFVHSIDRLVKLGSRQHCTALNYIFRTLLIKSERFSERDIKIKFTLVWYVSPHQYLRVKIRRHHYVNIDLWGASHGIKYGEYARGFNT